MGFTTRIVNPIKNFLFTLEKDKNHNYIQNKQKQTKGESHGI